jgi:hypothetical protein
MGGKNLLSVRQAGEQVGDLRDPTQRPDGLALEFVGCTGLGKFPVERCAVSDRFRYLVEMGVGAFEHADLR